MSDLTTSLKEIFNERISSPFYGSLIVSWLLWNWKISYVTFFVDQSRLGDVTNKIDYIFKYCNSPWHLAIFPLLSTALIVLAMPYVTNYAFKKTAEFDRKRKDMQIEIDRTQVLTIEQSVQLLTDIQKQKDSFRNLLSDKDEQIKLLTKQLENATKPKATGRLTDRNANLSNEFKEILTNKQVMKNFEAISAKIQNGYPVRDISVNTLNLMVAYDLIKSIGPGRFEFTDKGKSFLKEYLKQKNSDEQNANSTNRLPK
jgi:hypothetical protein